MGNLRIFEIAIDDILLNPAACSLRLEQTLERATPRRVDGMCADDDFVYLSLMPREPGAPPEQYRFAELSEFGRDQVASGIMARYNAGFSTVGSFVASDAIWALFRRDGENRP